MHRSEPNTLYCGKNNDFIAERERVDSILWASAYAGRYRN
jgi:hypothetical protein